MRFTFPGLRDKVNPGRQPGPTTAQGPASPHWTPLSRRTRGQTARFALLLNTRSSQRKYKHSINMRFTSMIAAVGLLSAGAFALEKPLDIQVEEAVQCSRKTKTG